MDLVAPFAAAIITVEVAGALFAFIAYVFHSAVRA